MSGIRVIARKVIDNIPDRLIRSTDKDGLYTKYTGYTQAMLEDWWGRGKNLTGCNAFVGWYGVQLIGAPKPNWGTFYIETELPKWGKGDAWVKSEFGKRPKYGDVLLHAPFNKKGKPQLHMDIALDFDGDKLNRIQAGLGGMSSRHDAVGRVVDDYDHTYFAGWLDLDKYFGIRKIVAPTPKWLEGWWAVQDRIQYYYYFGQDGYIYCTTTKPVSKLQPFASPDNEGEFSCSGNNVLIEWGTTEVPVSEKFTNVNMISGTKSMKGTGVLGSVISATKMF